jgi:hypothetical protein
MKAITKSKNRTETLYFAASTFFAITKSTSDDALFSIIPPIAVTNLPISTYKQFKEIIKHFAQ